MRGARGTHRTVDLDGEVLPFGHGGEVRRCADVDVLRERGRSEGKKGKEALHADDRVVASSVLKFIGEKENLKLDGPRPVGPFIYCSLLQAASRD